MAGKNCAGIRGVRRRGFFGGDHLEEVLMADLERVKGERQRLDHPGCGMLGAGVIREPWCCGALLVRRLGRPWELEAGEWTRTVRS
jgi:hypothetical protein